MICICLFVPFRLILLEHQWGTFKYFFAETVEFTLGGWFKKKLSLIIHLFYMLTVLYFSINGGLIGLYSLESFSILVWFITP